MSDLAKYADELRRAATQLEERASQVVRKAALDTVADAKQLAPVDTGALRNSISMNGRAGDLRAEAVATVNYAAPVEYGHITASGSFVPPQPYMGPAMERNAPGFYEAIAELAEGI